MSKELEQTVKDKLNEILILLGDVEVPNLADSDWGGPPHIDYGSDDDGDPNESDGSKNLGALKGVLQLLVKEDGAEGVYEQYYNSSC